MKNFQIVTPPPPEKLSYPHKFRVLAFVLLFACVFALAGCADSTALKTATYEETVDGVLWEVTYNTDTREVVSICSPHWLPNDDISSPFHFFMEKNYNRSTVYCVYFSGKPIKKDVYSIEQKSFYATSATREEWEIIKQTFPSCSYSEDTYDIADPETGEVYTKTDKSVCFNETAFVYEQKIIFHIPAA